MWKESNNKNQNFEIFRPHEVKTWPQSLVKGQTHFLDFFFQIKYINIIFKLFWFQWYIICLYLKNIWTQKKTPKFFSSAWPHFDLTSYLKNYGSENRNIWTIGFSGQTTLYTEWHQDLRYEGWHFQLVCAGNALLSIRRNF